ncbi:endonuclease/exonuclease/phosphatase family protein [Wenzhouxiangella sp. EGI_FJ10409]|uniref:endonuclease/exonuclease/phosphatase family protein n=1 Tax=Wenzhouxiangella sp. EGI_FJ10409 TaxID=3243767 RepID=UPI0035DBA162
MRAILAAALLCLAIQASAQTETIAYWAQNANDLPGGGFGFTTTSFPQAADEGVGELSLANFDTSDTDGVYDCIASFGGTSDNALGGYGSGGSLSPQGCSGQSNNGMHIDLAVDTSGYEDVVVSWAQRGTSTGFDSRQVSYSVDGGSSFTPFETDSGALGSSWSVVSYDFSAIGALEGNSQAVIRITLDGASSSSGNNRFDNILIEGTPGTGGGGLTLSKTGPANVEPEETLVYDISVGNTSVENDITGLVVTDTLPADVSYVSDTSGVTPTNPSAGVYEWDFGTLAAEGSIDFSLTVEVAAGASGDLTNQIEAAGTLNAESVTASDQHVTGVIAPLSIHQVQGEGLRSPFAPASGNGDGDFVALDDNIVTALADNGFFLQMPDDRDSSDLPLASRGIFVYTAAAPTVAVGDRLTLGGNVAEFFDSTQITNPTGIDVLASGEALPEVVDFDAQLPSPDPESPSCGVNNFECFEGMRVRVADAFVTAPNQSFGTDPVAEAVITASGERSLREPGVEYPGLGGTCPQCAVWDGNPEAFEIDFDRLGLANAEVTGGTRLEATGVLGYEFSDYEIWPTSYQILEEPSLPVPAPVAAADQVSIASLNALNLFDTVQDGPRPIPTCDAGYIAEDRETPSQAEYDAKLDKVAGTIIDGLGLPDVIAFQEVESADVLDDLAARIDSLAASPVGYESYLVFGNDRGNINNGYLVNPARVAVDNVEPIDLDACLSSDNTPLHDRPSLQLEARFIADGADWPFVVINNHMRSLGGIEDETRTRLKRHEQSQSVAARIQALQTGDPSLPVVVIGDMNAFQFSDGYVDVVGLLSGTSVIDENLVNIENDGVPGFDPANQVDPVLHKPIESLPVGERYSFIFRGVSQALDHALLSDAAQSHLAAFGYARGNVDVAEAAAEDDSNVLRSSDHDGLVVILDPAGMADRIFSDRFAAD